MGRWCAEGSDTNVRSYRALVKRSIAEFIGKLQAKTGYDDVDEEGAINSTKQVFEAQGIDKDAAEAELNALLGASKAFFVWIAEQKAAKALSRQGFDEDARSA